MLISTSLTFGKVSLTKTPHGDILSQTG